MIDANDLKKIAKLVDIAAPAIKELYNQASNTKDTQKHPKDTDITPSKATPPAENKSTGKNKSSTPSATTLTTTADNAIDPLKINPMQALENITTLYKDCLQIQETEATKRRKIEAKETIELAKIESQRQLFMAYLERSFDERRNNFEHLFQALDQTLESGNTQQMSMILGTILNLAKESPFAALADLQQTQAALMDPNTEWDL